ncbi:MAG: TRAP transporter substrate-binding protein [Hyphomicrobiaceae bacterium]
MSRTPAYQIRLGGYGPSSTCFSKGLRYIGERLSKTYGDEVDVKYIYNILDLDYRSEDILWLVESGMLTIGYQSTSYFTQRVPEMGVLDLPFVFQDRIVARNLMDGELGETLAAKLEDHMACRILGYFENGFRHISNNLRPIHMPEDLSGMRIRVLPSEIQSRTFEHLGAIPLSMDLSEALQCIASGTIEAQENPLANTVTYGAHKYHRFHTLSGHSYLSRPIMVHRPSFEGLRNEIRTTLVEAVREAIVLQRQLAIEEENEARNQILIEQGEIHELADVEYNAFRQSVSPLLDKARTIFDQNILSLLPSL